MEFLYKKLDVLSKDRLGQGDLIQKSDAVKAVISQAHQYYADSDDYTHFIVLTQSCDLVRRRKGEFNAPYITIAAAKPLSSTMLLSMGSYERKMAGSEFRFHPTSALSKTKQQLERYLNNTEDEHFFLPESPERGIDQDLIVFLRLSVALRKSHYDDLACSKIAELEDVFQAKLGWLTGNIYSRVATPDIEEKSDAAKDYKAAFYQKHISPDDKFWLAPLQAEVLRTEVQKTSRELKRDLTHEEVVEIVQDKLSDPANILSEKIVKKLADRGLLDSGDPAKIEKARRAIASLPEVKTLSKQQ